MYNVPIILIVIIPQMQVMVIMVPDIMEADTTDNELMNKHV